MKIILWIGGAIVALFAIFLVVGTATGPRTYGDVADNETRHCIAEQGNGQWRASSGVTLETFCKLQGATYAAKQMCEEQPDKC